MKRQLLLVMALVCAVHAFGYPAEYSADVSTEEKKAALVAELWKHNEAGDRCLWPKERLKGAAKAKPFEYLDEELAHRNLLIRSCVNPRFALFPSKGTDATPMVVVLPGGGYHVLSWNQEGTEIAAWLNSLGMSAAVLLYRTDDREAALADAQRTMGILRHEADSLGIRPDRIGVIGFSAGANLAVRLSTSWRRRVYEKVDAADDCSCRPDFMMAIYPWDLRPRVDRNDPAKGWIKTYELDGAYPVDSETPPAFVVQSLDDSCEVATAVGLDLALRKAGVGSVLKVYQNGGHGYGLRSLGTAADVWSHEAVGWLAQFLK